MRAYKIESKQAEKDGEPADRPPDTPDMARTLVGDTTVEALADIMDKNPRGVLINRDELAGWVRGLDQYKGGKGNDRQFYLSL
jgi:putative DNA primase/helicase